MTGPHAMTAQAGAVAYIKQSTLDKLPGCKYIEAAVFPDAGEDRTPLYTTPPAAVPVEALEGLVAKWRKRADEISAFAETQGPAYQAEADSGINWLRNVADELTQLIKERSNG